MIRVISVRDLQLLDKELREIEVGHTIEDISIATTTVPKSGLCRDWTDIDILYTVVVLYHSQISEKERLNG